MPSTRPPTPIMPKTMPKIAATGIAETPEDCDPGGVASAGTVTEAVLEAAKVPVAGDARFDTKLVNGTLARKELHGPSAY